MAECSFMVFETSERLPSGGNELTRGSSMVYDAEKGALIGRPGWLSMVFEATKGACEGRVKPDSEPRMSRGNACELLFLGDRDLPGEDTDEHRSRSIR